MSSAAPIQKWAPHHERIVRLHIAGMENKEIADVVGLTDVRISQVLNDPHAQRLIRQAILNIRRRAEEDIETGLVLMAEKAKDRLRETIDAEFLLGSKAKKHQDDVALSLLKGTGFLSKDFGGPSTEAGERLDKALVEKLTDALEKSNRVVEEAQDVVEADFELVEGENG